MATHVKVIAVLYAIFGVIGLVGAVFGPLLLGLLAGAIGLSGEEGAPAGAAVLGLTGAALFALLVVVSLPSLLAAWGLMKLRPWGRILAIILAVVSLLNWPIGTIFGIYALIILFKKETEALFVN